jgi:hypothetical protein
MLWVATGFAAGYVLGSKAGRERYEQIKQVVSDLMHAPAVADIRNKATDLAEHTSDTVAMAVPQARPVK